jgi:hypothetical protein
MGSWAEGAGNKREPSTDTRAKEPGKGKPKQHPGKFNMKAKKPQTGSRNLKILDTRQLELINGAAGKPPTLLKIPT